MSRFQIVFCLIILTALNVWGTPYVKLGYTSENTSGFGDAGGSVTPWVTFPAEKLQPYAGSKITTVEIDLNAKATNVYIYFRRDCKENENLYRQKVGELAAGHHEIVLDTPFEISGDQQIAVGYKGTFAAAKGAAFGQPVNDYACHAYYNTKNTWVDIRGSFCISAKVEGENLPACELGVVSLSDGKKLHGQDSTPLTLTVENLGTETVNSFSVKYSIDSEPKGEFVFGSNLNILPGAKYETTVNIPAAGIGTHSVSMTIDKVNETEDAFAGNNTVTASVSEPDPTFVHRIVFEEGTADWCSWCPRGIVGLEMMAETYPDEFIGIAVHGYNDPYYVENYAPALNRMSSLPNCLANRHKTGDPYYDIKSLFLQEQAVDTYIGYNVSSKLDGETVTVHSSVAVEKAMDASNLYFTFTVLENDLPGNQKNGFSGGDTEMEGWETRPSVVKGYLYQDVARDILPSYDGEQMLEGQLLPGQTYEFDYSFTLPDCIVDTDKVYIVGQVIDHSNGFILNAHKTKLSQASGIDGISAGNRAEVLSSDVYSIDGVLLMHTAGAVSSEALQTLNPGIVIVVAHTASGDYTMKHILP